MARQATAQKTRRTTPRRKAKATRLLLPKKASPLGRHNIRDAIERVFAARGE